jgi:hypothetical protein
MRTVSNVSHEGRFAGSRFSRDPVDPIPVFKPGREIVPRLVNIVGVLENPLECLCMGLFDCSYIKATLFNK